MWFLYSAYAENTSITIDFPDAFRAELPRLASHWFTLAVEVQSLGTRDINAFFDFEWDVDRMLLDVRVAALFWYVHVKTGLTLGKKVNPFLVTTNINYHI